jgi:hypothetical protein
MTNSIKLVQYGRVENYAVQIVENGSPTTVDVDVIFVQGKPARFVLDHKIEIDVEQLQALLLVLRKIGFDLGGDKE